MNIRFLNSFRVFRILSCCLLIGIGAGCATTWPPEVDRVLAAAGDNRAELERVLDHYTHEGPPKKLEAAKFLIANMEEHGYTVTALFDEEGNEVAFDVLEYENFNEAQAAMDRLEKEHGTLEFKRKRFDKDTETITADFLIENIDLAFQAWQEKPWAKDLTFETFCQSILPYRGSNEPLGAWRQACMKRYARLADEMENPGDLKEAGRLLQRDVHGWVGFSSLYYLHPTDQGYEEMNTRRLGRCEDISNMIGYAMRACAVPSATDYTPYWANRDNNHAWEVILDEKGQGKAGLSNRAAKVYRKTFATQPENLGCRIGPDEKVPRWLSGKSYKDVTSQYLDTTDVTVPLVKEAPTGSRYAYLCVFNGGEWKAIHWGEIEGGTVTFTDMGRNIAYLPAYFVHDAGDEDDAHDDKEEIIPAGPPLILTKEGDIRTLDAAEGTTPVLSIQISATAPTIPDADTHVDRPMIIVKPGKSYELFVWEDGWKLLGRKEAGEDKVAFDHLPGDGLFWLVEDGSRRLERIFTLEEGKQVWW